MNALAPLVAKARKLPPGSDYRAVLRALKKQQIANASVLPLYTRRLAALEDIVRREHVVTLPQRKASIRLASEAESAMQPAPHMNPPRLIGNTGEYGEFVLPLATPGAPGQKDLRTDDFTFDAATWTLTVHEARPGHELQFTRMLENGVSIARAVFAFNSANVEGWALYAESEMKPYLPARRPAGLAAAPDAAGGPGVPRPDAEPRPDLARAGAAGPDGGRGALRGHGQAGGGPVHVPRARGRRRRTSSATSRCSRRGSRAELALGGHLDRQRFNDFILAQGLLPPDLRLRAVMEEFVPAEKARAAASCPAPATKTN